MNIYVHKDGQQYGPFPIDQLREYLNQGSFTLQDQACYDGQNWVTIEQIPGLVQAHPPQQPVTPVQQQQSPARSTPVQSQAVQATTTTVSSAKSSKKKLIIWGSVGAVALISIVFGLLILFSGDDKENDDSIANDDTGSEKSNESYSASLDTVKTEPKNSKPRVNNTPLLERIPTDTGAVVLIRVDDLLEKGGDDIAALLPPGLPPLVGKALEDPTSLGLDVSQPFQIHLIPNEDSNLAPTGGLAGKLSDKEKFMNTIELLGGLDKPAEKDGYLLYAPMGKSEPQISIGSDFFYAGGADSPKDREPSIEKFMTADGSDSLIKNQDTFESFSNEKNDIGIWFGGDSILDNLGANLDNVNLDTLKGGSGTLTLNFEDGEMVGQVKIDAPNNDMVYGKGGFSDGILNFAPADAILALGFAFDLLKFIEYAEKELLPEFGDDIKLNKPMPELGGLTIRDAISSFTGEFLTSITDVKMPDSPDMDGIPGGSPSVTMEEDPFGDDASPVETNPFADDMEDSTSPFPDSGVPEDFPGGAPPGGMDLGGMMVAAMPKPEFIVAASIDTEKWLKLKAAPPLAMGLGFAMMQGYSITEKNDFLLIASKDHIEASQSGSVKNSVSGSGKEIFEKNDFVLKINIDPILKLDLPIPPGGPMEILKDISHLEMASSSSKTSGSGTMKLAFTDKNKNSLSQILKMVKDIQTIVPDGMNL